MLEIIDKKYQTILEELEKYCCLGSHLDADCFRGDITEPLKQSNKLPKWTYDSGATKLVLIFSGMDTVVKIPFTGTSEDCYTDGDWNATCPRDNDLPKNTYCSCCGYCSYDGCPRRGKYEYWDFDGANANEGWDYCEAEVRYYDNAKESCIEDYFAKTWLIGTVHGHPIYAQARAEMFEGSTSTREYPKEKAKTVSDYCHDMNYHCFNDWWLADFVDFFGMEALDKLQNFLENEGIEDLHDGNIGYVAGVPVLIDYAGYNH
jgi:hypothetical protein